MIDMLLLGFGLLVVVGLGVALLEALIRRAELGAALVLGLMVLQAVLIDRVPALTLPGGIRVLPYDVVFTLLLAAAVARLLRMRRFSEFHRSVVLLGVMLLLAIVRGVAAFGVEHSVAEFRLYVRLRLRDPLLRHLPAIDLAQRSDRQDLAGGEHPHDGPRLYPLAGDLRGHRRGRAGGAVRRRRGHPGHRWALHLFPRTRRRAHGSLLGAARRAGTQADAAGCGAASVRRGAEPSHRLARPARRCRGGHVAQPQARASGGRHARRRRRRHRSGVPRAPGVRQGERAG